MGKYEAEIKFLQELSCHSEQHNEKLYELFAKYKDSEALKKAILAIIDAYTALGTTTLALISELSVTLVKEAKEKGNTVNNGNTKKKLSEI